MRHVRGLRDIKTHGTLAREGRLVSVARDWRQINRSGGGSSENESWDGNVERMVFKRNTVARSPARDLFQDLALEREIRTMLVRRVQESIAEMEMFAGEEVPGVFDELQRLGEKLSQLESMREG